jgi:hypothetical protein
MREFGGMKLIRWTKLALPTTQFFPRTDTEDLERGSYLFDRVKGLMNIADWPCELRPVRDIGGPAASGRIMGQFQMTDGRATISYDPSLIPYPMTLIAVFAHELSHYRLSKARSTPPGGADVRELTTELAVAFAGFGIFSANVAFDFKASVGGQYGGSYSARTNGYLSQSTWAFAIALFCALKGENPPLDQLKHEVAVLTRDAAHYLAHKPPLLESLRGIN